MISCIVGHSTLRKMRRKKLQQHFEADKVKGGQFKYVGFDVIQSMTGITLNHGAYTENIQNYQISPN